MNENLIPIQLYLLTGTAIILAIIGYYYTKSFFIIFAAILMMLTGFSIWNTGFENQIGTYQEVNTSQVNLTTYNQTYLEENTTSIGNEIWGLLYVVMGLYWVIIGALSVSDPSYLRKE